MDNDDRDGDDDDDDDDDAIFATHKMTMSKSYRIMVAALSNKTAASVSHRGHTIRERQNYFR